MQKFKNVDELVNTVKPVNPVYCIRPDCIKSACRWFKDNFPGNILYAVKTNPNEKVIKYIGESGISRFDVASINEIKLIKKLLPKSRAYYMNTIKNREHIKEASQSLKIDLNLKFSVFFEKQVYNWRDKITLGVSKK